MSSHSPRDRQAEADLDRLLASAMPGMLTEASAECVDAETLAAWSEGSLAVDVAHDVETHLSTCGRCQAVVAVFVRAEPAAPAAAPVPRFGAIRWLVPLATAAAVLIAVGLHFRGAAPSAQPPAPVITVAQTEQPSAPVPPPTPQTAARGLAPKAAAQSGAGDHGTVAAAPRSARAKQSAPVGSAESNQATGDRQALLTEPASAPATGKTQAVGGSVREQSEASAESAAPAGAAAARSLAQEGRGGGAGGRTGAVSVTVEVVANQNGLLSNEIPILQAASGERSDLVQPEQGGPVERPSTAAPQAVPPPIRARWRVLASGTIERSTNNAQSWARVDTEPPGAITAGSAPANNVCWFVGHGGLVIVFTLDGTVLNRPAFPEPTDLVSIQAFDARNALITTADGRGFETTDGGGTWRRIN